MGTREIVEGSYRHFVAGQVGEAFAACSPDFRFSWIADPTLVQHTANHVGRDGLLARIGILRSIYDFHELRPMPLIVEGDRAAAQVFYDLSHRESGRRFALNCSHFWVVRGERIAELVEYYDTALIASVESGARA